MRYIFGLLAIVFVLGATGCGGLRYAGDTSVEAKAATDLVMARTYHFANQWSFVSLEKSQILGRDAWLATYKNEKGTKKCVWTWWTNYPNRNNYAFGKCP